MNWKTWAPLQSKEAKDICAHVTSEEKKEIYRFAMIDGVIVATFFAMPVTFAAMSFVATKSYSVLLIIPLMVTIGIFIMLSRVKQGKKMLCSTKWAKEQGYTPDKI